MQSENNMGCDMVGMLDIKGQDQCRRVYSVDGIAPTLTTSGGGQRQVKIFDTSRLRVRKLTPKEYGILQAFPMDEWEQVVSDSQAYKQFGNAVTTTVFSAIAKEIAKSILESEESEELTMGNEFKGMNPPIEETEAKPDATVETIKDEAEGSEAETAAVADNEPDYIEAEALAKLVIHWMMQKLKEEIVAVANNELNRANENFPLFASKHEGAAVIYEELQESKEALEELETSFACLWDEIRGKETPVFLENNIKPLTLAEMAINLACEATQTAAMFMKYEMSMPMAAVQRERGEE